MRFRWIDMPMEMALALSMTSVILAVMLPVIGCVEVPVVEQWPRTSTTGVRQIGVDTYFVEIIRRSESTSDARLAAYHQARTTCEKQGKIEIIVKESHTINYNTIELTFRCLSYDDPEIQRRYFEKNMSGAPGG